MQDIFPHEGVQSGHKELPSTCVKRSNNLKKKFLKRKKNISPYVNENLKDY